MAFSVEVTAGFGDPESDFANYPDFVTFNVTAEQRDGEVTLDQIIRYARSLASQELPLTVELKSITVEIKKVAS
jgi:hypothetical protein